MLLYMLYKYRHYLTQTRRNNMETELKVGTSEKIAEFFDKVEIGNYWTKEAHKRLYINNDILAHLFNSKRISHNTLYADPYIDISNGKWGSKAAHHRIKNDNEQF